MENEAKTDLQKSLKSEKIVKMLPRILLEWIWRPTLEKVASRSLPDMP